MADLTPIWQEDWHARWMFTVASERQDDDPYSGWVDIDADARRGVVEINGVDYTPTEARNYAEALRQAADHAERFGHRTAAMLFDLTCAGRLPEIAHLPSEQQFAIREALRAAGDRYRKGQAKPEETRRG
ncbi:hypothetical protein JOF56_011652 [Kibdelosporangium banguiense]|uniref:Uncharacterized protein n=1 Tax=Kibdelosporangium banguiense TaxID=1365924 RepID=A0ABS4U3P2_9PSEU|nr:hypothetical protein [Kibdelosporangium banguiense]MBP2331267.1 hypothetical protein [Kibdelosporangium banguiense]